MSSSGEKKGKEELRNKASPYVKPPADGAKLYVSRGDESFETLNFWNLTQFYRDELRQIESGVPACRVISMRITRRLRETSILNYDGRGASGVWQVSEKAKAILDS